MGGKKVKINRVAHLLIDVLFFFFLLNGEENSSYLVTLKIPIAYTEHHSLATRNIPPI